MTKNKKAMTAREKVDQFFSNLGDLEGMDKNTAVVLQKLWIDGKLERDGLLSELEKSRAAGDNNVTKKA